MSEITYTETSDVNDVINHLLSLPVDAVLIEVVPEYVEDADGKGHLTGRMRFAWRREATTRHDHAPGVV